VHAIDGKAFAESLKQSLASRVVHFAKRHGRAPGLAVVLVGEDPASKVYTRNKEKTAAALGMAGQLHVLDANTTEATLLALIDRLNADDAVDGILIQLPLPPHLSKNGGESRILWRVDPAKDVDGFHPMNAGRLALGLPALTPCTPRGSLMLLKSVVADLTGAHAVVIGRSNIVGKPMAQLLLAENATVTLAHSKTRDLPALCRTADVLVAAVGRPEMVRGDWVREGAVVIDVGINRVAAAASDDPQGSAEAAQKTKLVGDVAYVEAATRARAITPVPGGVGPMTIACLMQNTLDAADARIAAHQA
jgi:methylenetetrahydrofolate dehydrogenase (NADP+)/methenyltetrahydrofolate cyclohydrolase